MTTTDTRPVKAQMPNRTNSEGEKRMVLGLGLDAWNNLMVWSLSLAAFAAVAVVVTTRVVIVLANQEAADASEALEIYKADAATAVGVANEAAAQATAKAAALNERAANLEREAETAKLETARIKQLLAWREISLEQKTALVEALKGKSFDIIMGYWSSDPEVREYANQLRNTLIEAGIRVDRMTAIVSANIKNGVTLNGSEDSPDFVVLRKALEQAGIALSPSNSSSSFGLMIGPRPRE